MASEPCAAADRQGRCDSLPSALVAGRKQAAIVRAATGDDVVIGETELQHAMRHFPVPRDLVLALIARVLEHPTVVLADDEREPHEYRLFYGLDDGRYLLAVVKLTPAGPSSQACIQPAAVSDRRIVASERCFHEEGDGFVQAFLGVRSPLGLLARRPLR